MYCYRALYFLSHVARICHHSYLRCIAVTRSYDAEGLLRTCQAVQTSCGTPATLTALDSYMGMTLRPRFAYPGQDVHMVINTIEDKTARLHKTPVRGAPTPCFFNHLYTILHSHILRKAYRLAHHARLSDSAVRNRVQPRVRRIRSQSKFAAYTCVRCRVSDYTLVLLPRPGVRYPRRT